jgi:hypothetical protein
MGLSVYRKSIRYYDVQVIKKISAREFNLNAVKGCVYCARLFESLTEIKDHLIKDCNTIESLSSIVGIDKLMKFENYNNRGKVQLRFYSFLIFYTNIISPRHILCTLFIGNK